jgi:ligand-binding SRPBCC domain-containing protein
VVFAALANPGNLPRLMPAWQNARIVEGSIVPPPPPPTPLPRAVVAAGVGTRLLLSFCPFPLSPLHLRWEAQITEFAWNDHFCDRQLRGPFAFWLHRHSVSAVTRDGIRGACVVDLIEYELPFGPLGRLAHRLWLRTQIERSFAHRQTQFAALLARATSATPPSTPAQHPLQPL